MDTKIKATRAGHKGVVTKLIRKFEDIQQNSNFRYEEVTALSDTLVQKQKILVELNGQILDLTSAEDTAAEIEDSDEYMLNLETKIREIRTFIHESRPKSNPSSSANTLTPLNPEADTFLPNTSTAKTVPSLISHENGVHNQDMNFMHLPYTHGHVQPTSSMFNQGLSSASTTSSQNHRLPKLDLPYFNGDVLQWQTFWDSYESTIHYNSSLTDIQKFSYLKAQLQNNAAQAIEGFALTNANYCTAINLLKERFGQPHKIIHGYMKALMELPSPSNDLQNLRNYGDKLEAYIRGLESLGQTQEMYGTLLAPVVMDKLPPEIRKNIAREHGTDNINLTNLRRSLMKEVSILEVGHSTDYRENRSTVTFFTSARSKPQVKNHQNKALNASKGDKIHPCLFCDESHSAADCTKITDANSRIAIVRKKRVCFNCLGSHRVKDCKSKNKCRKCNHKHHTSLCGGQFTNASEEKPQEVKQEAVHIVQQGEDTSPAVLHTSSANKPRTQVMLKTAVAPVKYGYHSTHANLLFDEGAQRSFITARLATELNVRDTKKEAIQLSAFGDTGKNVRYLESATIELQTDNGENIVINTLIVPDIAVPLQNYMTRNITHLPYLRGLKLAHPLNTNDKFEIDMLIGADFYWEIVQDEVIRGDGPTAVSSRIGYLLSGPVTNTKSSVSSVLLNIISSHQQEERCIENFWKLESLGISSNESDADLEYLRTYQQSSIKFENGQYSAKLPWKPNHDDLPTNYMITKARTENTIKRLSQDQDLLRKYSDIIEDQEKRGFIEKVEENTDAVKVHYISHHAVKKDSATTPLRIVYDCSCRQSPNHASLNDCLMSVPPAINDLTQILLRFRMKEVAVSTDIEKAFLHINLDESDRDVTRFLWLSDPSNLSSQLTTYRFKSILFGATCSPFILNATLLKHLDQFNTGTASGIKEDLYVDNILSSFRNEEEAIMYFKEARTLMSTAGFNLRSWASNSKLLNKLAASENVLDKDKITKILGLRWNTETDKLSFAQIKLETDVQDITKREILRESSRIYDPLGLLSSVTVSAKILLQELWKRKIGWDEPLTLELQKLWNDLAKDLETAMDLEVDRQYLSSELVNNDDYELHVFVDASLSAYGAVAYITTGKQTSIVMAKNRVAPLRKLTLPQLELMAALIGTRLAQHVSETLQIQKVTYWSDSQIVLHWLNTNRQLKKFVQNRINEIKNTTSYDQWRYCPTKDNPADLLTRGIPAKQFVHSTAWFKGPKWLIDMKRWPSWNSTDFTVVSCTVNEDNAQDVQISQDNNVIEKSGLDRIVDITRYSTFRKLIRVTAYIRRFISNCKMSKTQRQNGSLSTNELEDATKLWIRNCQERVYADEIFNLKCKTEKRYPLVKQLRLYLDSSGMIRCGGRIHNAPVKESAKFPYLLPQNQTLTKLIVLDVHVNLKHAGVLCTVTQLRQTYWIPSIRQYVRKILHRCLTCRQLSGKPYRAPDPPPLPKMRLIEAPPFTVTGVDFTGALYVKEKNGTENKAYVCLFTCATTRAVHLEVVSDLTEESFLQAFRRFTSRKSLPRTMISDNASTYLAASETIVRLTKSSTLKDELSKQGTSWEFIPKRTPWYGGFWERLIGLTKNCLRKTLGRSYVTLETLQTVIAEIEAIINDRPLTYISSNIEDDDPLTPSHLLYGRRISTTPYPSTELETSTSIQSGKSDIEKRGQLQIKLIEHFWTRWKMEYLTSLREFHRASGDNKRTINIGDVVHIQQDQPRNKWRLGIIEELTTGNDGHVRSAIVRTSTGRTSRPIVKLYPVELNESDNTKSDDRKLDDPLESLNIRKPSQREAATRARDNIHKWTLGH